MFVYFCVCHLWRVCMYFLCVRVRGIGMCFVCVSLGVCVKVCIGQN